MRYKRKLKPPPPYKMVLKNEVKVSLKNMQKIFKKCEVYVVGYGSLLFEHGWRRRNMVTPPKADDLVECRINNYKRGPFGQLHYHHFYGVIRDNKQYINAVLARVHTLRDWEGLMRSEYIAGLFDDYNYRVVDVTDLVYDVKLPKNAAVHMVANEPINERRVVMHNPAPGYYDYVWTGVVRERSEEFKKEFLETGGVSYAGADRFHDHKYNY